MGCTPFVYKILFWPVCVSASAGSDKIWLSRSRPRQDSPGDLSQFTPTHPQCRSGGPSPWEVGVGGGGHRGPPDKDTRSPLKPLASQVSFLLDAKSRGADSQRGQEKEAHLQVRAQLSSRSLQSMLGGAPYPEPGAG